MSDEDNFPTRKPAVRVFARELNDATHQFKESDDDRAPNWTLLPTGEKANRVLISGTITATEDVGSKGEYWRGRIIDSSGGSEDEAEPFFVYAGQYQPEAMAFLRQIEVPAYVTVVGKPSVYESEEEDNDTKYVSVRPEEINEVSQTTRDNWVIDTASHTIARVQRFAQARENGELTPLMEDAIAEYDGDPAPYLEGAQSALRELKGE